MSVRKREWPVALALVPVFIVILGPFFWLLMSSLKTEAEIGQANPFALPAQLMWQNYADAWQIGGFSELIVNSLMNLAGVVALTLITCAPAGYALAKIRFPGREWMFYAIIFGLTIPVQAIVIPLYQVLFNLGLINSLVGITLAQVSNGIPFGIFLMRSFFIGVVVNAMQSQVAADLKEEEEVHTKQILDEVRALRKEIEGMRRQG